MQCLSCGVSTPNPKFCSKSCSAKVTNRYSRKRRKEGSCATCRCEISASHKYCAPCRSLARGIQHKTTLGELRRKLSWRNFHVSNREMSRSNYEKSGRAKVCVCGYSLHVDICHIRPISDFADETLLSVVNGVENLVALCKNCHWELDNGFLNLSSPTGTRTQISQASPH